MTKKKLMYFIQCDVCFLYVYIFKKSLTITLRYSVPLHTITYPDPGERLWKQQLEYERSLVTDARARGEGNLLAGLFLSTFTITLLYKRPSLGQYLATVIITVQAKKELWAQSVLAL